jgi:HlyD family secretion protein
VVYEIDGQRYEKLILEDIRIKQLQVEAAQEDIEQAAQTVEQAQRSLEQAKKAVAVAQKQLDDASIIAPFDGSVAALDVKEGDIVAAPGSSSGVPVYIVDSNSLEINAEIDEIDVANIEPGQRAIITLDSFPNDEFEGKVTAISLIPISKPQNSGVVVYEVKIGFTGGIPPKVKSGMSAVVDIVTSEKKDVVLVPNKSIRRNSQGQTVVNVVVDQKIEERAVVLGQTDGTQTEVISGLNAGETIIKYSKETNAKLT